MFQNIEIDYVTCLGKLDLVKNMIETQKVLPVCERYNILHTAVLHNRFDIVKYLCENVPNIKYDLYSYNLRGETPLNVACAQGHLNIVKYLIEQQNVDPERRDQKGRTALHHACMCPTDDVAEYLIKERNVNTKVRDRFGKNPLTYVYECCYPSKMLLFPSYIQTI